MMHLSPAQPDDSSGSEEKLPIPAGFASRAVLPGPLHGQRSQDLCTSNSAGSGCRAGVDAHGAADQGRLAEAHRAPVNHKVTDAASEGPAGGQAWGQQRLWNTPNKHRLPVINWFWIQGSNHMVHFRVYIQLNHI